MGNGLCLLTDLDWTVERVGHKPGFSGTLSQWARCATHCCLRSWDGRQTADLDVPHSWGPVPLARPREAPFQGAGSPATRKLQKPSSLNQLFMGWKVSLA